VTHKQISLYFCTQLTFYTKNNFKNMIKKRLYEKPSMKVVLLKRQPQLLAGSGNGVDPLSPFAPGNDPLNP